MKNRRGLIIGMWLGLMTGAVAVPASAADVPAPGNVKLKIETKRITQAQAEQYVKSGEKLTLGVFLVLDANWKAQLEAGNVRLISNQFSFAFFNDDNYTKDDFLNNPEDYINICRKSSSLDPPGSCTDISTEGGLGEWYSTYDPYDVGNASNQTNVPIYAYGGLFYGAGAINISYPYTQILDESYQIKLFEIQFILKASGRDFPIGVLDEYLTKPAGGSAGNTELNIADKNSEAYRPNGIVATDWTRIPLPYFEFIPGGLFIERAPEVEKLEPLK